MSSEPVPVDLLTIRAPAPDWFRWAISHPGQSQFVMLAGCRIHYLRWARAPAKPGVRGLLFVHGGGAHSRWWSYIAPYFTRDFRVAAIDLSGMGDSGWRSHYTSELRAEEIRRLGLGAPALVGHSFGGMVACEIAAAMPERVKRLVLIDPLGLWRDELPVNNWMILPDDQRRQALFADPAGGAAERFFELPAEPGARAEAQAGFIWSQACTGKFVWPLPDKGLKKRMHRIAAPSLIVWGDADAVIAPDYAQDFAERIADARVALIARAGHLPHLEQPEEAARLVREFLGR